MIIKLPQIGIIEQPQMDVKYSDKGHSERCLHGIQRSVYSVPIFLHNYCTSLFCPHVKIAVGRHFQHPRRI